METKTKIQAGAELLDAMDAYINAVMAEREKKIRTRKRERLEKYIEEHRNDTLHIPDDDQSPYAQHLRENLDC